VARVLEVAYIANVDSLERGNLRAGASTEATAAKMAAANAKAGTSYGELVAKSDLAGKSAAANAARMGASLEVQSAAYSNAAKAAGLADDKIASSARLAGEAAAKRAATVGAALDGQRAAYVRAAETAKAESAATAKAAEASAAAQAASSKRVAAEAEANAARITSAAKRVAVVGLLAIGGAAFVVKKSADALAEIAKETRTLHNVTGLSVQSASAYAAVAKAQDLNVKQLNMAFGTLAKNIHAVENAHAAGGKAAAKQELALKQLGLPLSVITKAHGDLNKVLPEITKRFEAMPGGIQKTAIGMALFGRGWQTLVPLMHSGALGLKEQLDVAQKMGATLGGSSVKNLKDFAKAQEESKYATLGLQLAVGQYLAPALTKLIVFLANVSHSLGEGVHWLKEHETAAKVLAGVVTGTLGFALTVYASSKAKAFIGATKDMIGGMKALAVKVGLSSAAVDTSFAGTATAAEVSAAKTATAVEGEAAAVVSADTAIEGANAAAGASFLKLLGPIAAVAAAAYALNKILPKGENIESLLGGNQPGESGREGEPGLKKYLKNVPGNKIGIGDQKYLDTSGGIMAFFESKGLTPAQAAGIVGNIQQESSFNPKAVGKEGARGLAQGLGSRAETGSVTHQLEQIWRELASNGLAALRRAKTPSEAARIFEKEFEKAEGGGNLATRELYAEHALKVHPKAHHQAGNLGYYEPGAKAKKPAAVKEYLGPNGEVLHETAAQHAHRSLMERKAKLEDTYVQPFAQASGVHRSRTDQGVDFSFGGKLGAIGPGIIEKVKNFQGFGETIVELLTSGPHKGQRIYTGLETGGKGTVHAGQHVRAGQQIARGYGTGGIEMGFAGPEGLPITRGPGETAGGKAFSRFLGTLGKGGKSRGNLEEATLVYTQAAKKEQEEAAHLMLTAAQKLGLHGFVAKAGVAHAAVEHYAEQITGAEGAMGLHQARRLAGKQPLSSAAGANAATENAAEAVAEAKAVKGYYQHELSALRKEAKAWAKLRDSYRSFARHAHGHAKKEALDKAAGYQGKIDTADKDAKTLGGSIEAQDTKIVEAEAVAAALPAEIATAQAQATSERQGGDLSAYQAANAKVDAEVRAGMKTEAEGKAAKEANAQKAIAGGYGELSEEGLLQVKGDLREFGKALTEATSAVEAHTNALKESAKALNDFLHAGEKLATLENGTILKGLADLISGQIGGVDYHGRQMTAGSGSAARY
jgi:hypothetical protein